MRLSRYTITVLFLISTNAYSELSYLHTLLDRAGVTNLSDSNAWHALVYYRTGVFVKKTVSEVDDEKFFLSTDGKNSPSAELQATIKGLFVTQLDDQHPQCRFPARTHWLQQQLSIDMSKLPDPDCLSFKTWFKKLNPEGASLIFPAAYIDSPSSMFGHTLLRIDKKKQNKNNEILAYTITYAAQKKPEDSELAFVYKGLVGGYPGDTSVLPYYIKLKEYRDIESRDIWEYHLNLTQEEADQLVRHIWEIENTTIAYYFFTENCSYRVLALLDVIRPEHRMIEDFYLYVIPVDTVRLVQQQGWVSSSHFRPSVVTTFNHQLNQLSEIEKQQVLSLVPLKETEHHQQLHQVENASKIKILDVAYQYSRLAKLPREQAAHTSYQLLRARQSSDGSSTLNAVSRPLFRDDEGHLSSRIRIQVGVRDKENFTEFQWRPAYHDLTDPALGYSKGSELKFLETTVRYYEDDGLTLHDLTAIGIKSIKPRTDFFKSTSWSVASGARRVKSGDSFVFVPKVEGQLGPAYQVNDALIYALIGGEFQLSKKLAYGYDTRAQANVGIIWHTSNTQSQFDYLFSHSVINGEKPEQKISYKQTYNINQNWVFNITAQREREQGRYFSEYSIGTQFYF